MLTALSSADLATIIQQGAEASAERSDKLVHCHVPSVAGPDGAPVFDFCPKLPALASFFVATEVLRRGLVAGRTSALSFVYAAPVGQAGGCHGL